MRPRPHNVGRADWPTADGENKRSPPLFAGLTAGIRKKYNDDVLAIPTNNTRIRKSTIPAVDSPAMATRGKRGNK